MKLYSILNYLGETKKISISKTYLTVDYAVETPYSLIKIKKKGD